MIELTENLKQCIRACHECHELCLLTMSHCLKTGGEHASPDHMRLMTDCVMISGLSADFMIRQSDYARSIGRECAYICSACAFDCERLGGDEMLRCAEVCRRCAAACKRMAAGGES